MSALRRTRLTLALLAAPLCALALATSACNKEEPDQQQDKAKPMEQAKVAQTTVAEPPAVALDSIPAQEDFEEEAEQKITAKNLEDELDAMEKEMEND